MFNLYLFIYLFFVDIYLSIYLLKISEKFEYPLLDCKRRNTVKTMCKK